MKTIIMRAIVELATGDSCILVFLPGIADISTIQDELDMVRGCRVPLQVLVLHSLVPKEEQASALEPALDGHCKVVLSTNIAETSLTIPDAAVVLDTGLRRYGACVSLQISLDLVSVIPFLQDIDL